MIVVERAITAYHQDEVPEWVAELECGHNQHVRHRPPFQLRAWITEETGRTAKLGMPLECPLCDRAEMPEGLLFVRSSPEWTEQTVPQGLLRTHRLGHGTWGRILVQTGTLRFIMSTEPPIDVVLGPGSSHAIPPDVEHEVQLARTGALHDRLLGRRPTQLLRVIVDQSQPQSRIQIRRKPMRVAIRRVGPACSVPNAAQSSKEEHTVSVASDQVS